jgi:hypothetical protein
MPYQQAEGLLMSLAEVSFSDSAIWRCVQTAGEEANTYLTVQTEQRMALPDPDQISAGIASTAPPLGVSMDGVKFNVRGEGWKEVKVGCIFHYAPTGEMRHTHEGAPVEVVQASDISYVFHFGPPEPFGQLLWAQADQRGWLAARQTVVLGDGAYWIWNQAELHFNGATPIVDWYHAKQHLWEAAHLIYGPESPQALAFVNRHETHLYTGPIDRITQAILRAAKPSTRESLQRAAAYFSENTDRMQYERFQRAKLPIGSGTVESACKQFKDRYVQAGMRWSRNGAINLMPFRAAVMSNQFDQLWHAACH